jgi:hypothetical protein
MGTNTGLGIGIGIPFKNNALGGDKPYFPPELKARMIGVWTNYGKKNTDTDRNIIKNKIPNAGGDLDNDYGDEHFNKQEAKRTVDEMYHVKDGKKYIGEKYDMQKAHEVCSKFKDKLEDEVEVADVYVAINAQYHDYCELFEKWFGKGNFDDMIFESAISFWFDDVDFGEDKLWKYFNELK